jgi:hypothetical protein
MVMPDRYVGPCPVVVLGVDEGRVGVEKLGQRDSISPATDSVPAVCASREVAPPIGSILGETALEVESLAAFSPSASESSLSGEPDDRERIRRPSS